MSNPAAFSLDPTLAADTVPVSEGPVSRVLLMDDSRFPWLILVPRQAGATALDDLAAGDRAIVMEEMIGAARALRAVTGHAKINWGALGNLVPQLHLHVIARHRDDAAWPGPVWGVGMSQPYTAAARDDLVATLRAALV